MDKSEKVAKENDNFTMGDSLTANAITPYHSDDVVSRQSNDFEDNPRSTDFDDNSSYSSGDSEGEYDDDDVDDEGGDGDDLPLSLEEVLYSANSFHAIVRPVSTTMMLAALAAVYINNEQSRELGEQQFASAYNVWEIDSSGDGSIGKNLALSIGNTLIMVCVIGTMTFGIVLLYKYR